jgi:hypothetical protein
MTAVDSLADHPEILFLIPLAIPVQRNDPPYARMLWSAEKQLFQMIISAVRLPTS